MLGPYRLDRADASLAYLRYVGRPRPFSYRGDHVHGLRRSFGWSEEFQSDTVRVLEVEEVPEGIVVGWCEGNAKLGEAPLPVSQLF